MTSTISEHARQRRLRARAAVRGLKVALGLVVPLAILLALFWNICVRMPGQSHEGPLPAEDVALAALEERLRFDVIALSERIGERNDSHPAALERAAEYIELSLKSQGFAPQRVSFEVRGRERRNIEVEVPGTPGSELVVVGAHYDSAEGARGANDNASGVAAALALAAEFRKRSSRATARFVFFVNEEPPHFQSAGMGSLHSAVLSRTKGERVAAMLSLETLGYYSDDSGSQHYPFPLDWFYPDQGSFVGFVGNLPSCKLLRRAIGVFREREAFPSQGGCLPESLPGVGWSDHWAYWQQGFPALMVTDTALFRYPHYHTQEDTADKVDFARLARVVRGLAFVIDELVSPTGDAAPKSRR